MSGADLTYSNLRGANLTNANLENANLTDADMRGAEVSGTNMRNITTDGNFSAHDAPEDITYEEGNLKWRYDGFTGESTAYLEIDYDDMGREIKTDSDGRRHYMD
jgi:hypothetical protein